MALLPYISKSNVAVARSTHTFIPLHAVSVLVAPCPRATSSI